MIVEIFCQSSLAHIFFSINYKKVFLLLKHALINSIDFGVKFYVVGF